MTKDSEDQNMTASMLRQKILSIGGTLIDQYVVAATGANVIECASSEARVALWETLEQILLTSEDAVDIPNLSTGEISDRVDCVLEQVATGKLTIAQGKRLIEMLQAGFEITELPKLVESEK